LFPRRSGAQRFAAPIISCGKISIPAVKISTRAQVFAVPKYFLFHCVGISDRTPCNDVTICSFLIAFMIDEFGQSLPRRDIIASRQLFMGLKDSCRRLRRAAILRSASDIVKWQLPIEKTK